MRNPIELLDLFYLRGKCPHPSRQKAAKHWMSEMVKSEKFSDSDLEVLDKARKIVEEYAESAKLYNAFRAIRKKMISETAT